MKTLIAAIASIALAMPLPLLAQENGETRAVATPTAEKSPYLRLVEVMSPNALHEATFINTVAQLRGFYLDQANMVTLDKQCPGFIDAIFENSEAEMRAYHWAEANMIREIMLDVITENLTEEEVLDGIRLYGSPLGQKVILTAGQTQNLQNTMQSAASTKDGSVDREAFDRDSRATTSRILNSLTAEEYAEFGRMAIGSQFIPAFTKVNSVMQQRKFDLLNSDAMKAEKAAMEQAMTSAMQNHIKACE